MAGGSRESGRGARTVKAPGWSAAIGIGALALAATGCSGGASATGGTATTKPVPAVAARLQNAVVQTDAANSVAVSLTATGVTHGTTSTLVTGSGSFDLTRDVGQMSLSSPALASALGQSTGGSITVLSDGTNLYLNIPQLASLTSGKTWLEVPIAAAVASTGANAGALSSGALGDPTNILGLLSQYGGAVTTVGPAAVGGTPTTEYQANITLSQVAARAPAGGRHPFTGTDRQGLQKLGITTIPVTVWVGSDGRLRQAQVTVDLSHAQLPNLGTGSGSTTSSTTPPTLPVVTETIGFTDYGLPVTVTPPSASQVTNLSQALKSLRSMLPGGSPAATGSAPPAA
jgi:hypothetical protein